VQQDALPKVQSSYSSTSSARASTEAGRSRPSAFAVLRLTTNSYFVGTCTGRSAAFSPLRITSGEAVLVNPITSVSDQATSGREVALRVYRRQLVPRCKGNDKIAIAPSGRAPRHDQTAVRRAREGRYSAFNLATFAQVDRGYLHPEQWRYGLYDGKIADSRPLAGIPEDRHLRDPRRNFFE